jgi:hypothetical protein
MFMNKKSGTAGFYGGDKYSDAGGNPDAKNLKAVEALLDERERPVYEHRLAA